MSNPFEELNNESTNYIEVTGSVAILELLKNYSNSKYRSQNTQISVSELNSKFKNSNSALIIPVGSTEDRPNNDDLNIGQIRFNTNTNTFEGYDGEKWNSLNTGENTDITADNIQLFGDLSGVNSNASFRTIQLSGTDLQTLIDDKIIDLSNNYIKVNIDNIASLQTLKSNIDSPNFTGIPTAPTPSSDINNQQIATTEYVQTKIDDLIDSAPGTLDTLNELAAALNDDSDFHTSIINKIADLSNNVDTNMALKATIDNPSFTGKCLLSELRIRMLNYTWLETIAIFIFQVILIYNVN